MKIIAYQILYDGWARKKNEIRIFKKQPCIILRIKFCQEFKVLKFTWKKMEAESEKTPYQIVFHIKQISDHKKTKFEKRILTS